MLSHNYDYASNLRHSLKINWQIEDVIAGRTFDFEKPFLPEALAGVAAIHCLTPAEKLKLNQIRGYTYLYLFGFVEEFILPFILDHARTTVHGADAEVRALLRFAEEEAKHIELFKWFTAEFERGFGSPCGTIGPAREVADAILKHSPLGVILTTLHIEWMTQLHYVDSVRDQSATLDPLFTSLLKHHWLEEAQHAKVDTLITDKIASALGPREIERGVDDYMSIGKLLDGGLASQIDLDLESLARATHRSFADDEKAEIKTAQQRAYRWTFLLSGMTHPNFRKSLGELTRDGASRVEALATAIS